MGIVYIRSKSAEIDTENFMTIRKSSLLGALTLMFVVSFFSGCGPAKPDAGEGDGGQQQQAGLEEQVKQAEEEAMNAIKENHEMRKEVFKAKLKLGEPTDQEESTEAAPAEGAAQ
jgi:enamine deaminase RidA (YjgF/YER057c/UK114 family)